MNPTVDRTIIVFITGIILSFLEMNGYVDPSQHTQIDQSLQAAIGGLIAIVTIVGYLAHHASVTNTKTKAGANGQALVSPTPQETATAVNFLTRLKSFIFKTAQTTTQTTTETTVTPQDPQGAGI